MHPAPPIDRTILSAVLKRGIAAFVTLLVLVRLEKMLKNCGISALLMYAWPGAWERVLRVVAAACKGNLPPSIEHVTGVLRSASPAEQAVVAVRRSRVVPLGMRNVRAKVWRFGRARSGWSFRAADDA